MSSEARKVTVEERSRTDSIIQAVVRSDDPPREKYTRMLGQLMPALGSRCAVMLMREPNKTLHLVADINFLQLVSSQPAEESAAIQKRHSELIGQVYPEGASVLFVAPPDDPISAVDTGCMVLSRFDEAGEPIGVLHLFIPADDTDDARQYKLDLLDAIAESLSTALTRVNDPLYEPEEPLPLEFWKELAEFSVRLQRSLRVEQVSAIAVQEATRILNADAVSLTRRRGKKTEFLDDSNSLEKSNARANLVVAIEKLSATIIDNRDTLAVPLGDRKVLGPQQVLLSDFLEQSAATNVLGVPLFERFPIVSREDLDKEPPAQKPEPDLDCIGCLMVEYAGASPALPQMQQRTKHVALAVESALANAVRYEKVPLRIVWFGMADAWDWLKGRGLMKTGVIAGAIALLLAVLLIIPVPYNVEAEGHLMPATQRFTFAPFDGTVEEVLVTEGQEVNEGDPLVVLFNEELRTQVLTLRNRIAEQGVRLQALEAQRDEALRVGEGRQVTDLQGQIETAIVETDGLRAELKELLARESRKTIVSPVTGTVTTFQPKQILENRAVGRGQTLIEVMAEEGDWRLELAVEERRMGHILDAQSKGESSLPVEFWLATDPEESHEAKLTYIATRPDVSSDGTTTVEVHAAVETDSLPRRRIGADSKAAIATGRKSLFYWAFGDFIDFLRRQFWI